MTTDNAGHGERRAGRSGPTVDELFRRVPVQSPGELACDGIFDSDEEVDEFIAHVHATRRVDLA